MNLPVTESPSSLFAGSYSFRSITLFLVFAACFIAYQYQEGERV